MQAWISELYAMQAGQVSHVPCLQGVKVAPELQLGAISADAIASVRPVAIEVRPGCLCIA